MLYYYVKGKMGMTRAGSFTKDRSAWTVFAQEEVEYFGATGYTPYGTAVAGRFVSTDRY
jgi:hypothetical protein